MTSGILAIAPPLRMTQVGHARSSLQPSASGWPWRWASPKAPARNKIPSTAIDIALEPDATMLRHAKEANAHLLESFPKGFALDETHHPHVTLLQQFVRTADLDHVFAAANAVLARRSPGHGR